MANLYNMNKQTLINDVPFVSWKNKAFTQISSIIKKNKPTATRGSIFSPNPLKIYRREIAANMDLSGCHSSRVSTKIDELDRPNGSLIYNSNLPKQMVGSNSYVDLKIPNNKTELPGSLSACTVTKNTTGAYAFSQAQNALRRVRSSGMVKKQFSPMTNKSCYYTDTKQYLTSRSKTFSQNQFSYFSTGNPLATPGTNAASGNTYYANGTSACGNGKVAPVYFKPSNPQFCQQGGVSSSSLTNRLKYDTVTTSASQCKVALGPAAANALAYGVSDQAYTIKNKLGFPLKKTPVINKYTGKIRVVNKYSIPNIGSSRSSSNCTS